MSAVHRLADTVTSLFNHLSNIGDPTKLHVLVVAQSPSCSNEKFGTNQAHPEKVWSGQTTDLKGGSELISPTERPNPGCGLGESGLF